MSQLEDELKSEDYTFANCHRTGGTKVTSTEDYNASDKDSSKSKEVVPEDARTRKDGPGGN